ncbi:neck whiskers [Aeromonas phage L9-6]|nr:neck whiskers [Aeromonas phage L9-6]
MIEHLTKGSLPYVDGAPEVGQARIDWIKNGERLCGASTKTSNDGTYNRPTLNVQKNVEAADGEQVKTVEKVNEIVDTVNIIVENLGNIGNTDLIEQVNENTSDIVVLKQHVVDATAQDAIFTNDIAEINLSVGQRLPADNTTRDVYNDLFWIKTELGAYNGFDINGGSAIGSIGSGLKYRFGELNTLVGNNSRRITTLEDNWNASDVGQLTSDLEDMRLEIGRSQLATGIPIYTRLRILEDGAGGEQDDVEAIKLKIDFSNETTIAARTTLLESTTSSLANTINRPDTGLLPRLTVVENQIGSTSEPYTMMYDINQNAMAIVNINQILGSNGSSGIQGEIALINAAIGPNNESGSINGRISVLQQEVSQITLTLADIDGKIGDENSGLVGANIIMSTDLYGDASSIDPFTNAGIKKTTKDLFDTVPGKLDRPAETGRWYFENGAWKKASSIMVAVEKSAFDVDATEAEVDIPFIDFEQTIANGCVFNNGVITFSDNGLVEAKIDVEVEGVGETDNYEVAISHDVGGVVTRTVLQEFAHRPIGKRLYTRDWLYTISSGDKVSVTIKALDSSSVKTVNITDMSIMIVPV